MLAPKMLQMRELPHWAGWCWLCQEPRKVCQKHSSNKIKLLTVYLELLEGHSSLPLPHPSPNLLFTCFNVHIVATASVVVILVLAHCIVAHGGSLEHTIISHITQREFVYTLTPLIDCLGLRGTFYQIRYGVSEDKLHTWVETQHLCLCILYMLVY